MLDRVAFTLFGVWNVYWYGIFIAVGLVLGIALMLYSSKKSGMDTDNTLDAVLLVVPFALIFARLHYVVWSWEEFSFYEFPEILYRIVAVWDGGMAIYGGIIGGIVAILIYCKWKKLPPLTVMDWIMPGLALGQAIGRWGNYVNQEIYGSVVTNPALQWFPMAVWIDKTQEFHYALFFYESMCDLAIFAVLFFVLSRKFKIRGIVTAGYFTLYGLVRGVLEGFRLETFIQNGPGFPVNQVISFLIAALGIGLFIYLYKHPEKYPLYDRAQALEKARLAGHDEDEVEDDEAEVNQERPVLESFVIGEEEDQQESEIVEKVEEENAVTEESCEEEHKEE